MSQIIQVEKRRDGFWMRSVSLAGLHRVIHLMNGYRDPVPPKLLCADIVARGLCNSQSGNQPSATTLYHIRRALLHLGIAIRHGRNLRLDYKRSEIADLLDTPPGNGFSLSDAAKPVFCNLIVGNADCRKYFFDLFCSGIPGYSPRDFMAKGESVSWRRQTTEPRKPIVTLVARSGSLFLELDRHVEIVAIVYGIRYWVRNDLNLLDEFFRESRGVVMYPLAGRTREDSFRLIMNRLLQELHFADEWVTLSIKDLVEKCCEEQHLRLKYLFELIRQLQVEHSGRIGFIPTSRSFASLTAQSRQKERLELRGYLIDRQGRYISHLRFHKSIREAI